MPIKKDVILLVDDEVAYLHSMAEAFEAANLPYKIHKTIKPFKAVEIARALQPDLIITDWDMPKMTGIQLILALKDYEETRDIPIIMCTGIRIESTDLAEALRAGAVDFIRKPIDTVELLARTRMMLHLGQSTRQIKQQNQQLARHIEIQQKRLLEIAETVADKNKMIAELQARLPETPAEELALKTITELRALLDKEKDWATFEAHFDINYPQFLMRLMAAFPQLSKQELRICMLIKVGMSSTQIANLLFLAKRSIDSHRHNIRKKVGLDVEQELSLFLETI